ncbi:copper homeostasis protein CutC [Chondrinema litorale]|uniref:copper homeostasis protein CutC n=1 Tax=Chondrinema litorale TaxID=2994555 RepID=UPI002543771F|nr:copper homeostasis protein CutC [Chondrinema litorale]UZR93687.1 copper homeostasis protein CutC [Chondrinema litorale]
MKKNNRILEVCAESVQSAIAAFEGGADRIELCSDLLEGGISPSAGLIKAVKKYCNIPVFVLIRPRGGDFLYDDEEKEIILHDIETAINIGADGIVSGFLNKDGTIDIDFTKRVVELTHPLPFTFHRAFDVAKEPFTALKQLIDMGVKRILTSGQKNTALEGASLIKKLIEDSDNKLQILIGSGINSNNILEILNKTGGNEFHASCRSEFNSKMEYIHPDVKMGKENTQGEYSIQITDIEKVKDIKKVLSSV